MTTSKTIYRLGYQPLAAGVFVAPFPYAFRYGWDETTTVDFCLSELDFLLHGQTDPAETAAMVIEPVLGEGGYVPLPAGFLEKVREICDHHSILLVVDEVQSGFARTGKFYAYEHYGVTPDIVIMAKGLASGLPMSAIAAPMDLMKKWLPGAHGGTYGANPVAAAAAGATIQVINEENLVENARLRGHQLMAGLRDLQGRYPFLTDIRGLGLMVGVELGGSDKGASKELSERIQANCLKQNMLLLTCGTYGNVIRWIPPLIVTEEEIDRGLSIFAAACQEAA
jgi:4-aminobutyrate aminotransferase